MNAIEIHQEVIALLQAWGYKPEVTVNLKMRQSYERKH